MFNKIDTVSTEMPLFLNVVFRDGKKCRYDMAPLVSRYAYFKDLRNPILFSQATVAKGGYGVVWNSEIDLCADDIYEQAR